MKNRRIIIITAAAFIIITILTISVIFYKINGTTVILDNIVDCNVYILPEIIDIDNKTIEFAVAYKQENKYCFGMILYDKNADNLLTNATDKYESYKLVTNDGHESVISCQNKSKKFFSYSTTDYNGETSFIIKNKNDVIKIELQEFNDSKYSYYMTLDGITVRAIYPTKNSKLLLYDAYLSATHPLAGLVRSDVIEFDADNITLTDIYDVKYNVKIKGETGICSFVNDYNNIKKYTIPKCFGMLIDTPKNKIKEITIENFTVKYYVDLLRPLTVNYLLKKNNINYKSEIYKAIVWENRIIQILKFITIS